MKYYWIVEVDIKDPSWLAPYAENVTRLIEARGGRYLARSTNAERIEGDRTTPSACVIVEWPSRETAVEFYQSEEYRPFLDSRLKGATNHMLLVAGVDVGSAANVPT